MSPADRAAVSRRASPIVITFSEPIARTSINVGGGGQRRRCSKASTPVPLHGSGVLADNRTRDAAARRAISRAARSKTLTVKGAPDGPKDDAGLPLLDPFVSTFTVRDSMPTVVSVESGRRRIAGSARRRRPRHLLRTGGRRVDRGAGRRERAGRRAAVSLAVGGTVAIFTPVDFLRPNTSYTATVSNVADTAGNALVGGTFATIVLDGRHASRRSSAALQLGRHASRRGDRHRSARRSPPPTCSVSSTASGPIARARRRRRRRSPPRSRCRSTRRRRSSPPWPSTSIGNRSAPFCLPITIQPNAPPTVTLTNRAAQRRVGQGQTLTFDVRATDDDQLAQIVLHGGRRRRRRASSRPCRRADRPHDRRSRCRCRPTARRTRRSRFRPQPRMRPAARAQPAVLTLTVRDAVTPTVTIASAGQQRARRRRPDGRRSSSTPPTTWRWRAWR